MNKKDISSGSYVACGYNRAWIMWDLDNGHANSSRDVGKGYFWVFKTRKDALSHRNKQHKMKLGARLSYPVKIFKKNS